MGKDLYLDVKALYINADGGGRNSSRSRLWKSELQKFTTESGLTISVSHFPPGTSKWNKIEHRLFSYISKKLAGQTFDKYRSYCEFDCQYGNRKRTESTGYLG